MNDNRIKQIRNELRGAARVKEVPGGRYPRQVIEASDFGWISEIQIEPEHTGGDDFLSVKLYAGDTKQQGKIFFGKNPRGVAWPEEIGGYPLSVEPYIRFAHFNSSLFWLHPTAEESKATHNLDFFRKYAGRYWKKDWPEFNRGFETYLPDWKNRCRWREEFERSNRTYFDLAIGTLLTIYLPEKEFAFEAERQPAGRIREVIEKIRHAVDGGFNF